MLLNCACFSGNCFFAVLKKCDIHNPRRSCHSGLFLTSKHKEFPAWFIFVCGLYCQFVGRKTSQSNSCAHILMTLRAHHRSQLQSLWQMQLVMQLGTIQQHTPPHCLATGSQNSFRSLACWSCKHAKCFHTEPNSMIQLTQGSKDLCDRILWLAGMMTSFATVPSEIICCHRLAGKRQILQQQYFCEPLTKTIQGPWSSMGK